tara:strand:+ start:3089 stop:3700 length:612 start_codon:yes stop_codon:yes gene_type:complete
MKEYIYDEEKYGGKGLQQLINLYETYDYELFNQPPDKLEEIENILIQIIDEYPQFLTAYQELYSLYEEQERFAEQDLITFRGYAIAKSLVIKNGKFPEEMHWMFQENRPVIRFLYLGAEMQWVLGNVEEAKYIFEGLLNSNPYDNIGARFVLLAINEEMSADEFDDKFQDGELFEEQMKWFDKKAPKHKIFNKFFDMLKTMEE